MEQPDSPAKIRIDLNGEFSALELEEILATLATARAGMLPAVPLEPPSRDSDAEVSVQDDALFKVRTLVDGGVRIWLRSEGFGWTAFTLKPKDVAGLREFLSKQTGHTLTAH